MRSIFDDDRLEYPLATYPGRTNGFSGLSLPIIDGGMILTMPGCAGEQGRKGVLSGGPTSMSTTSKQPIPISPLLPQQHLRLDNHTEEHILRPIKRNPPL